MHTRYLESIKSFEGFTRTAKWDYAQHTNGFGTKALYSGEQISRVEAERRFAIEIEQARQFVDKHAKGWDDGTKAALTSLTFNAGTRWATSGLGEALRNSDLNAVKSHFLAYTKADGVDLPGLVKRRLAEVAWIGEPPAKTVKEMPAADIGAPTPAVIQDTCSRAQDSKHGQKHFEFAVPDSFDPVSHMAAATWLLRLLETELLRLASSRGKSSTPEHRVDELAHWNTIGG